MKLWILTDADDGAFLGAFTSKAKAELANGRTDWSDIQEVESDPAFPEPLSMASSVRPMRTWQVAITRHGDLRKIEERTDREPAKPWIWDDDTFTVYVGAADEAEAIETARAMLRR